MHIILSYPQNNHQVHVHVQYMYTYYIYNIMHTYTIYTLYSMCVLHLPSKVLGMHALDHLT